MSVNSLESLLARMRQGSVTQGWGAISIFSRGRLNRLLEQQYIERFNGFGFLPPFSGKIFLDDLQSRYIELEGVTFGQPRLSFNTASLTNSTAVVTMSILSGRYVASRHAAGAVKTLSSMFNITEAQGFTLEMDIDLSVVVGEIDKQGRVRLNLAEGVNFRCNLAGDDEATNTRLSVFLKQSFQELPAHRSVFQLGMLELKGYSYLTPTSFRILTHAAPGAKVRGALNFGEGAVVIFIRLAGNATDGRFPPDSSFPYLLPDDQEPDGSDRYSAALILSEAMIPYIENDRLDVLNNLLFPGDNVFEELGPRHRPADLAVFGNINAKRTRISLEPTFQTVQAGGTQRFTLRDWNGAQIQASEWDAVSLQSHTRLGHGTISDGLYTAAAKNVIGHDSLHVVVTAKYLAGGITYTASALLLVVYDDVAVAPRTTVYPTRTQSQPIVLKASTVGAASVGWVPLEPEYGTLTHEGNQATFTPDARSRTKGLVVQQIDVSGAETRRLSLVLLNAQQQLRIDPAYVPAVSKSVDLQLMDDATLLPGLPRRWKVISGVGTVSSTGHFTASAQGPASSSVVQCEIVSNGVVLSSGYSVIDLSELEPELTWETLAEFTIKVPGGLGEGRLGSLYANGYQQLKAQIVVETHPNPVDKNEYPLSVTEKASMRLVDDGVGDDIEPVDEPLDGIPASDSEKWRSRWVENRFDLAEPRVAAQDNLPTAAISRMDIYLHSRARANEVKTFHAMFQKDSNRRWIHSTDYTDPNNKIEITPLAIPQFQPTDYDFERVRVDGGSGAPGDPEDDDFDFHLRTVDYWKLRYVGNLALPGTAFETLEFVSVDANDMHMSISTSSIRWESEQMDETMFSWTGYIFKDPLKDEPLDKVKFDEAIKDIVKAESLDIDVNVSKFEQGLLVISLHRSDRIPYIRQGNQSRDKLSRDLAVILIDKRGNPHSRRISFLPQSTVGDRNRLVHTLFTPPSR